MSEQVVFEVKGPCRKGDALLLVEEKPELIIGCQDPQALTDTYVYVKEVERRDAVQKGGQVAQTGEGQGKTKEKWSQANKGAFVGLIAAFVLSAVVVLAAHWIGKRIKEN